jgi:choline dehydrogenase
MSGSAGTAGSAEHDYVIVGSGSAGSVLANRLSASGDRAVLVLEAGPWDRNFWLKLPVGYFRSIYDERFSRSFATVGSEGDGFRGIPWPRGRVVGGSSSINGLIFIRGQHEDFDGWAAMGAHGWSYDEVLPAFRRLERHAGGEEKYHGRAGELAVSELRNANAACAAWLAAAEASGLPANADFNGASTYGVGRYQLSLGRRLRASAAAAFLRPALRRPNLELEVKAQVTRILIEKGKAIGVEWLRDGEVRRTYARRDVILCAGTIQSPHLLQLSGVGPAGMLRARGIDVQLDAPEVGRNLQDHYQMRLILRLKDRTSLNNDVRNPLRLAGMGLQWLFEGKGPLTVGAGQVGGAACTSFAKDGRPDVQFNVMPLSVDKPGMPLHAFPGFTASVWQCHPQSRGSIELASDDPLAAPRIAPNYFAEEIDRKVMIEGVRMLRDIHGHHPFRELWEREEVPGADRLGDHELWDDIRTLGGTVFHPVGTCRMGDDDGAVVDPELRVRGMEGLRVIDASIMPRITSANTNAATLMIAERAAELMLGAERPPAGVPHR